MDAPGRQLTVADEPKRNPLGMGDDPAASYEVYAVPRDASEPPAVFYEAGRRD